MTVTTAGLLAPVLLTAEEKLLFRQFAADVTGWLELDWGRLGNISTESDCRFFGLSAFDLTELKPPGISSGGRPASSSDISAFQLSKSSDPRSNLAPLWTELATEARFLTKKVTSSNLFLNCDPEYFETNISEMCLVKEIAPDIWKWNLAKFS